MYLDHFIETHYSINQIIKVIFVMDQESNRGDLLYIRRKELIIMA